MSDTPITTSGGKGRPGDEDGGGGDRPELLARPQRSYAAQLTRQVFVQWGARLGLAWVLIMVFAACFSPFLASSFPLLMSHAEAGLSSPLLTSLQPADVVLPIVFVSALILLLLRRVPVSSRIGALLWIAALLVPAASWDAVQGNWARWEDIVGTGLLRVLMGIGGLILTAIIVGFGTLAIKDVIRAIAGTEWARREGLTVPAALRQARFPLGVAAAAIPVALIVAILSGMYFNPHPAPVYDRYRVGEATGEIEWTIHAPIPYSPSDRLRDMDDRRRIAPWWGVAIKEAQGAELTTREQRAREANHWLGTDPSGADVLARMIHASRIAVAVGFIATGIAMFIGVIVGGIMGYFSGIVDLLGMRVVEVFEAIPVFFLLLTVVAFFQPNIYFLMVVIGLFTWVGFARFTRAEFLKLRKQDFVQAAIAVGTPLRSILFKHMLPNGVAPALVTASFGVASAILYEATLSFLGITGVDAGSWGQMLSDATGAAGAFSWWMAIFPGAAIFLTVFAYTLIGESLRDAIDPNLKKASQL